MQFSKFLFVIMEKKFQNFSSQDLICPINYNPAEFYIDKLAIKPANKEKCVGAVNVRDFLIKTKLMQYFTLLNILFFIDHLRQL